MEETWRQAPQEMKAALVKLHANLGSAYEIHNSMAMHHVSEQVAALRRGDYDPEFLMN